MRRKFVTKQKRSTVEGQRRDVRSVFRDGTDSGPAGEPQRVGSGAGTRGGSEGRVNVGTATCTWRWREERRWGGSASARIRWQ
mmetsp:Transcript_1554/g.3524  ORF Transcript_1554/g.3524 Transcript_1554/m.3524 type:complete len:83 (-) Transcript_1554:4-252(-)